MNRKVVVVDDDPKIVSIIVDALVREGYVRITADTGDDAVTTVLREKPWLVVLGETLPDMLGEQMLETLEVTASTPRPSFGVMPIFSAVAGERSTMRPFTYGPRSWMVTVALLPVSRLVTRACVPSGRVLLAALSSRASMRVPSAILRPWSFRA